MNMSISSDKKKHNTQKIKIHQFSENEVHFKNVHVKKQRKKDTHYSKILQLKPAASVTYIT